MRISVQDNDPGYNPDFMNWHVKVDGVKKLNVLTADDETGYILEYTGNFTTETKESTGNKVEIWYERPLPAL